MTTTQNFSISEGDVRLITEHDDLDGMALIAHADVSCPFGATGSPAWNTGNASACPYCVGGATYDQRFGRRTILDGDHQTEYNEGNFKRPSTPNPDAPVKSAEERIAEVMAWLVAKPTKVEVVDVTHANKRAASDWLRTYTGDFEFLVDIKAKGGIRSDGQAKGVLNCMRADALRSAKPKVERPETPEKPGLDLRSLPQGHLVRSPDGQETGKARYAYQPTDGQAQFYRVDRPEGGRWDGWIFVKAEYGGGNIQKVTSQRPDAEAAQACDRTPALTAILTDPQAAMLLYGKLMETCGHCGRSLTNEESRKIGIGPVCRAKMGW